MKYFILIFGFLVAVLQSVYSCKCAAPTKCDKVCGSDGETYDSDCLLFCHSLTVDYCLTKVYDGPCKHPKCSCKDPNTKECKYVCGSNGITYGNECSLGCARNKFKNLKKVKDGKCGECVCITLFKPVCGTDGNTYGNDCELRCRQEVDTTMEKDCDGECPCKCPWEFEEATCDSYYKQSSTSMSS